MGYCCIAFCYAGRNAVSVQTFFWAETGKKAMQHGMPYIKPGKKDETRIVNVDSLDFF
jgi:hypothetical protein